MRDSISIFFFYLFFFNYGIHKMGMMIKNYKMPNIKKERN